MSQYTAPRLAPRALASRALAVAALGGALALGACGRGDTRQNDAAALNRDTALARDLSLAQGQTAAQPQLQDVPAATPPTTPAPAAPTPAPAAPAPRREVIREVVRERPARRPATTSDAPRRSNPAVATTPAPSPAAGASGAGPRPAPNTAERGGVGTIPAGSTLLLTSNRRVCTNNTSVGDHFTAALADAVSGSNGASFPAGATANVEVTRVSGSGSANDPIDLGLRVVSINANGRTYAVSATTESADVSRVKNAGASKDPQKVIGGAVVGGILGRIIGGGAKGTIIGAAGGAAAGAGVAAATARYEGCLNEGASMRVRLNDGVQVRLAGGSTAVPDPGI